MGKIEAEDLIMGIHLFSTKVEVKTPYKPKHWSRLQETLHILKVLWKSLIWAYSSPAKAVGNNKITSNNFIQREQYIINITTFHRCPTSYVPCHG